MFTPPARREFLKRAVGVPHGGWFLLVTSAIVVATLGVSAWWPYFREQVIIRRVEALGGRVEIGSVAPRWLRKHLDTKRFPFMKVFDRVWFVDLDGTSVDDSDLPCLSGLADGFGLSVRGTRITDAGLAHLDRIPNLGAVFLTGTAVTDTGMDRVSSRLSVERLPLRARTESVIPNPRGYCARRQAEKKRRANSRALCIHRYSRRGLKTRPTPTSLSPSYIHVNTHRLVVPAGRPG